MSDAQQTFEEREAFVMGRPLPGWPIIRVLTGQPLKIADTINAAQITEAYAPRETVKRRHPGVSSSRAKEIEHTRPLIPGYVFVRQPFNLETLLPVMLTHHKAEEPHKPRTMALRVRWLTFEGRYLTLAERAVAALRDSERARRLGVWTAELEAIVSALAECVTGVAPRDYVNLGDLQASFAARAA